MKARGYNPAGRVWASTMARPLCVRSPGTLAEFLCPVCAWSAVTRPARRGRAGFDHEWVCNRCSAHGCLHLEAL